MASGERNPLLKTDSPSRVTSRSSWISTKWCDARREIFKRTEFDPMSTAARVGMRKQCSKHSAFSVQHSVKTIQPVVIRNRRRLPHQSAFGMIADRKGWLVLSADYYFKPLRYESPQTWTRLALRAVPIRPVAQYAV